LIITVSSFGVAISNLKSIGPASKKSTTETLEFFAKNIYPRRFLSGNTQKFGFKPNTPRYDNAKRRLGYGSTQLVRTGALKRSPWTITGDKVVFDYPHYGKFLVRSGRDYRKLLMEERKWMRSYYKERLFQNVRQKFKKK
jgi:hypothetical protein